MATSLFDILNVLGFLCFSGSFKRIVLCSKSMSTHVGFNAYPVRQPASLSCCKVVLTFFLQIERDPAKKTIDRTVLRKFESCDS